MPPKKEKTIAKPSSSPAATNKPDWSCLTPRYTTPRANSLANITKQIGVYLSDPKRVPIVFPKQGPAESFQVTGVNGTKSLVPDGKTAMDIEEQLGSYELAGLNSGDSDTSIPQYSAERMEDNLRAMDAFARGDENRLKETRETIEYLKALTKAIPTTVEEVNEQATARTSLIWHQQREKCLKAREERRLIQARVAYFQQLTASTTPRKRMEMYACCFQPDDTLLTIDNKDECRECSGRKGLMINKRLSMMQCTCSLMTPVVTWRSTVRIGSVSAKGQSGWATAKNSSGGGNSTQAKETKTGVVTQKMYNTFCIQMSQRVDNGPTAEDDFELQAQIDEIINRTNHFRVNRRVFLKSDVETAIETLGRKDLQNMVGRITEAMNGKRKPRLSHSQLLFLEHRLNQVLNIYNYSSSATNVTKEQPALELPSPRFVYQQICCEQKWSNAALIFPLTQKDLKVFDTDVRRYKNFVPLLELSQNSWTTAPPVETPSRFPSTPSMSPSPPHSSPQQKQQHSSAVPMLVD